MLTMLSLQKEEIPEFWGEGFGGLLKLKPRAHGSQYGSSTQSSLWIQESQVVSMYPSMLPVPSL